MSLHKLSHIEAIEYNLLKIMVMLDEVEALQLLPGFGLKGSAKWMSE